MTDNGPRILQSLNLLSFNIQAGTATENYRQYLTHGWKHVLPHTNRQRTLDLIADSLAPFDIVCLQESDAGSLRSGFLNQTTYLAEKAGFDFWDHQPNRKVSKIAHVSNGLLSRIVPMYMQEYRLPGRIKGRGILMAKFGGADASLCVATFHLSLGRRARRSQLDFIRDVLQTHKPTVLMGDTNTESESAELADFLSQTGLFEPGKKLLTFPSWQPEKALAWSRTCPKSSCLPVIDQSLSTYSTHCSA